MKRGLIITLCICSLGLQAQDRSLGISFGREVLDWPSSNQIGLRNFITEWDDYLMLRGQWVKNETNVYGNLFFDSGFSLAQFELGAHRTLVKNWNWDVSYRMYSYYFNHYNTMFHIENQHPRSLDVSGVDVFYSNQQLIHQSLGLGVGYQHQWKKLHIYIPVKYYFGMLPENEIYWILQSGESNLRAREEYRFDRMIINTVQFNPIVKLDLVAFNNKTLGLQADYRFRMDFTQSNYQRHYYEWSSENPSITALSQNIRINSHFFDLGVYLKF